MPSPYTLTLHPIPLPSPYMPLRFTLTLSGHDYVSDEEALPQDWTTCEDGSHKPGSVRRAVNEFAEQKQLIISVTYRESGGNSWMIRKPYLQ